MNLLDQRIIVACLLGTFTGIELGKMLCYADNTIYHRLTKLYKIGFFDRIWDTGPKRPYGKFVGRYKLTRAGRAFAESLISI